MDKQKTVRNTGFVRTEVPFFPNLPSRIISLGAPRVNGKLRTGDSSATGDRAKWKSGRGVRRRRDGIENLKLEARIVYEPTSFAAGAAARRIRFACFHQTAGCSNPFIRSQPEGGNTALFILPGRNYVTGRRGRRGSGLCRDAARAPIAWRGSPRCWDALPIYTLLDRGWPD
jgi:hypothetical protein